MNIPLLDLSDQYEALANDLEAALARVVQSQRFIGGPEVAAFESETAAMLGSPNAIACASGTDALLLALWALGIGEGDEVITTPFTFFATAGAIARLGATPVFVDIIPDSFQIDPEAVEAAITTRTRAIIPVHLFGVACDLDALSRLTETRGIAIIEDAAQSMGSTLHGRQTGSIGDLGCFSFFPSKNLGAWGDGGLVTARDSAVADTVRSLRSHGAFPTKYFHDRVGTNSRLDALQAAILRVKLPHLLDWGAARRQRVARYQELIQERGLENHVRFQSVTEGCVPAFHQCVVRVPQRDALGQFLTEAGIGNAVYYPRPLHLQECFAHLGYRVGQLPVAEQACDEVLALPIFPELRDDQQQAVIDRIAAFFDAQAPTS
ncbi:MAG: transcriptional regulator [Deltaproteobacteria bacterium]|nr:transcriptional regulator [Deltaproteobacteria bacterium]